MTIRRQIVWAIGLVLLTITAYGIVLPIIYGGSIVMEAFLQHFVNGN